VSTATLAPRLERPRLDWAALERIRATRGRSTLLFITDRCPVGCAHCSVDSRRDSPTITDFELFGEILDRLCADPGFEVIGISGGEPFVERRGLTLAARRLTDAGKRLVVYTSGVWATRPGPPAWIREVLERTATVFLSTDAYHEEGVSDEVYANAARAAADAGCWIVVQVLDEPPQVRRAEELLHSAFGVGWERHAELRANPPLTHGRGAGLFTRPERHPGHAIGRCTMVASPMVRYDGLVTACCNESTIMGLGPAHLRRRAGSAEEVGAALEGFHADPMLRAIGGAGLGALTAHPRFADLAERSFSDGCQLCWTMLRRVEGDESPDPMIRVIAAMEPGR
jgi:organic radical activating enzyme